MKNLNQKEESQSINPNVKEYGTGFGLYHTPKFHHNYILFFGRHRCTKEVFVMSKRQLDVANDFREEFHKRVEFLQKSISVIIPITDEDANLLKMGVEMLTSFDEELQSAETLRDFSEFVDVEQLANQWPDIKQKAETTSMAVPDSIYFGKPLNEAVAERTARYAHPVEDDEG